MHIPTHFDQLLQAAAAEPEPQRLLFVCVTAELPDDATPAQRQRFAASAGGNLTPLMWVDESRDECTSFVQLVAKSRAEQFTAKADKGVLQARRRRRCRSGRSVW